MMTMPRNVTYDTEHVDLVENFGPKLPSKSVFPICIYRENAGRKLTVTDLLRNLMRRYRLKEDKKGRE